MATIVMESAKVIEAATSVINAIMAKRGERDARMITNAMAFKRFSFRKGFYFMTESEAINWINQQSFGSWGYSIYAWGTLDSAKKLLKLAQHGDPVTLNEDDIAVLF